MRGTAFHERFVLAVAALFVCAPPRVAAPPPRGHRLDQFRARPASLRRRRPPAASARLSGVHRVARAVRGGRVAVRARPRDAGCDGDGDPRRPVGRMRPAPAVSHPARTAATSRTVAGTDRLPLVITTLVAATPLFWVTASRPLSDMPGLAGALACQWLLLRAARAGASCARCGGRGAGVRRRHGPAVAGDLARRALAGVAAACGCGGATTLRTALGVAAAAIAGVLSWAVPMVVMAGGIGAYRAALTSQAGEDFEGVPMLVLQPGLRRLAQALADTFVSPWGWWPLAVVMLVLAVAGVAGAAPPRSRWPRGSGSATGRTWCTTCCSRRRRRRGTRCRWCRSWRRWRCLALAALGAPRCGASGGRGRAASRSGCRCSRTSSTSAPARPISEALRSHGERGASVQPRRPQVLMHRRVWAETRRARATLVPDPAFDVLPAPRAQEWQGAVRGMAGGRRAGLVAGRSTPGRSRRRRSARAARLREHVAWPLPVGGASRRHAAACVRLVRRHRTAMGAARWLGPDAGTRRDHRAAGQRDRRPRAATALVRGQAGASTLVIGGRYLAPSPARRRPPLAVRVGETDLPPVTLSPGAFAHTWTLPAGTIGPTGYAPLTVRAVTAPRRRGDRARLSRAVRRAARGRPRHCPRGRLVRARTRRRLGPPMAVGRRRESCAHRGRRPGMSGS